MKRKALAVALTLVMGSALSLNAAAAVDEAAAKAFAKKEDCFKCHAPDKTKKGPSYKKMNEKYKGKPESEATAKMFKHMTTTSKVKLEDGTEEEHKALDPKDKAKIDNLIQWIRTF